MIVEASAAFQKMKAAHSNDRGINQQGRRRSKTLMNDSIKPRTCVRDVRVKNVDEDDVGGTGKKPLSKKKKSPVFGLGKKKKEQYKSVR
jgi:hypothetical protein